MSAAKSRRILVSAPGKIIIHGEHAVVFGKRALAACLGLRTELTLYEATNGIVVVQLPDIDVTAQWNTSEFANFSISSGDCDEPNEADVDTIAHLKKLSAVADDSNEKKQLALIAFLYLFYGIAAKNRAVPCLHFKISSVLPPSAGLGSSAAFSVCLAAGLLLHTGKISCKHDDQTPVFTEADLRLINHWAFMAEKIIHGRPSGIDNSVATYGGALCFQSGQITPLQEMPNLRILLVNTKVPRSTKVLVEGVRQRHDKYPEIVKPVLDAIEGITTQFESLLEKFTDSGSKAEMYETMKDLVDMNQQLLAFLGVSHPALDDICRITKRHNLHSKLTGAGGGGCAVAFIPYDFSDETVHKVITELSLQGYTCFETSIGGPGVSASFQVS